MSSWEQEQVLISFSLDFMMTCISVLHRNAEKILSYLNTGVLSKELVPPHINFSHLSAQDYSEMYGVIKTVKEDSFGQLGLDPCILEDELNKVNLTTQNTGMEFACWLVCASRKIIDTFCEQKEKKVMVKRPSLTFIFSPRWDWLKGNRNIKSTILKRTIHVKKRKCDLNLVRNWLETLKLLRDSRYSYDFLRVSLYWSKMFN